MDGLTVPARRATTLVSIFMASMMPSTWLASTRSPGWTLTLGHHTGDGRAHLALVRRVGQGDLDALHLGGAVGHRHLAALAVELELDGAGAVLVQVARPRYLMTRVLPSSMLIWLVSPRAMPLKNTWLPMRAM